MMKAERLERVAAEMRAQSTALRNDSRPVYTTEDEIAFLRTLAKRGRWPELRSLLALLPRRVWDRDVDPAAVRAELERLLEGAPA